MEKMKKGGFSYDSLQDRKRHIPKLIDILNKLISVNGIGNFTINKNTFTQQNGQTFITDGQKKIPISDNEYFYIEPFLRFMNKYGITFNNVLKIAETMDTKEDSTFDNLLSSFTSEFFNLDTKTIKQNLEEVVMISMMHIDNTTSFYTLVKISSNLEYVSKLLNMLDRYEKYQNTFTTTKTIQRGGVPPDDPRAASGGPGPGLAKIFPDNDDDEAVEGEYMQKGFTKEEKKIERDFRRAQKNYYDVAPSADAEQKMDDATAVWNAMIAAYRNRTKNDNNDSFEEEEEEKEKEKEEEIDLVGLTEEEKKIVKEAEEKIKAENAIIALRVNDPTLKKLNDIASNRYLPDKQREIQSAISNIKMNKIPQFKENSSTFSKFLSLELTYIFKKQNTNFIEQIEQFLKKKGIITVDEILDIDKLNINTLDELINLHIGFIMSNDLWDNGENAASQLQKIILRQVDNMLNEINDVNSTAYAVVRQNIIRLQEELRTADKGEIMQSLISSSNTAEEREKQITNNLMAEGHDEVLTADIARIKLNDINERTRFAANKKIKDAIFRGFNNSINLDVQLLNTMKEKLEEYKRSNAIVRYSQDLVITSTSVGLIISSWFVSDALPITLNYWSRGAIPLLLLKDYIYEI